MAVALCQASCSGVGDLSTVLSYVEKKGVAVESCQLYIASSESNSAEHQCEVCSNAQKPGQCTTVKNYTLWSFSEWGQITSGQEAMKASIYDKGPIVCGMDATVAFYEYQGGIFEQNTYSNPINHYVELIGWGEEKRNGSAVSFWIGKNSWGQYWGESGLFRIQMSTENLGIETQCFYAHGLYQMEW